MKSTVPTPGIHHITTIASDPQRNLDFYTAVLGLRLVKQTVNFDDPGTYHLYYGNHAAQPGTILTFFPWPNAKPGTQGSGSVRTTAFTIPKGSHDFWLTRLKTLGITILQTSTRFGAPVITFADHDTTELELVESDIAQPTPPTTAPTPTPSSTSPPAHAIPTAHAITGFHSATIVVKNLAHIAPMLSSQLGMIQTHTHESRTRFEAQPHQTDKQSPTKLGTIIDILVDPAAPPARLGAGVVHHIAIRAQDDAHQSALASAIRDTGLAVTEQLDRNYFKSVYFRQHAGVLFEIATDGPGFAADEPTDALGTALKLPNIYESQRKTIQSKLLPLTLPSQSPSASTAHLWKHKHLWKAPKSFSPGGGKVIILLHGTGGNEHDLLPVAQNIDPNAAILSIRGNVLENGMPRFFARFAEGVFDIIDLRLRADQLAHFITAAQERYNVSRAQTTIVGYSNGANIASAMLLLGFNLAHKLVLLRSMYTIDALKPNVQQHTSPPTTLAHVLMLSGQSDSIVPEHSALALADQLSRINTKLTHVNVSAGHQLTAQDLQLAKEFHEQATHANS